MAREWTQEQDTVLRERGNNLLVSAAAGSGKTAVMVERIIRLITEGENPPDIDRFLVVTFTNAAAASMRERIRSALEEKLQADPGNVHLQRQVTLVHQAMITTIHSFCLDVVRSHFFELEESLDPGFRIADEGEMLLLKSEVLDALLEDAHAQEEQDPETEAFSAHFAAGKDDRAAGEQILKLYNYSCAYPWPKRFREELLETYSARTAEEADDSAWMQAQKRELAHLASDTISTLERLMDVTALEGGPAGFAKSLDDDLARFTDLFTGLSDASIGISDEVPDSETLVRVMETIPYETLAQEMEAIPYEMLRRKVMLTDAWGNIGRVKKGEADERLKEAVHSGRDALKAQWKELREGSFALDMADILAMNERVYPVLRALVKLTDAFEQRFLEAKLERGEVDFNDMEHFALRILVEDEGEELRRRPAAREYAEKFLYIMTDEYQDSNLVQESILLAVSGNNRGSANRFMVGDVKQSIYRFRQARPDLFIEKERTYRRVVSPEPVIGEDHKVELHRNFRSRHQILDCVNRIFRQVMGEDLGAVAYTEEAYLYPGAVFPEIGMDKEAVADETLAPELWLLDRSGQPADPEEGQEGADFTNAGMDEGYVQGAPMTSAEQEARLAGQRILELVGHFPVLDEARGGYRKAAFSDVAVLLRSGAGWADAFTRVFADMGIPAYAGSGAGYFETLEVRTVLSFLHIIDNPRQDIHLAGVLRSPMGGFTDDDLARIRSGKRDCDLYTALVADQSNEKTAAFLELLAGLRADAAGSSVHEILREILDVTGYEYYVLAMPGGAQRRANLHLLLEKALTFEQGSYKGLFNFLRYIRNIRSVSADFAEAVVTEEGSEAVQIMTIHKSKGLEFPIVLVCGLGRNFNRQDQRAEMILHPSLGVGLNFVDRGTHLKLSTIQRRIISRQIQAENLGEELRVLYVALTRAKEKLILTGSVADAQKAYAKWEAAVREDGGLLSYVYRRGGGRFLDYIMPQTATGDSGLDVHVVAAEEVVINSANFAMRPKETLHFGNDRSESGDGADALRSSQGKHLDQRFPTLYQYLRTLEARERIVKERAAKAQIPVTVSVSELKHPFYEEEMRREAVDLLEDVSDSSTSLGSSGFSGSAGSISAGTVTFGAERGTLYHNFMEHLDYGNDDLSGQLESMIKCGKIDECAREAIDLRDMERFLDSETGRRMKGAFLEGTLRREMPFVIGRRARDLNPAWDSDETVLVQGIIDAWFTEGEQIILLDYKTDAVSAGRDPEGEGLVRKYALQLQLYKEALESLAGAKVGEVLIWSFALGKAIRL